jgi:hypothetical protein
MSDNSKREFTCCMMLILSDLNVLMWFFQTTDNEKNIY